MSDKQDLARVIEQERCIQFASFDEAVAFSIGTAIRERGLAGGLPLVVDIRIFDRQLFFAALPGSTISLADWTRRKLNTVKVFHKSTYRIVLEMPRAERIFEAMHNLAPSDYVVAGGAFPIILEGTGVIGAIGVAGAHEREDHELVVETLCRQIGIDYAPLALPPRTS